MKRLKQKEAAQSERPASAPRITPAMVEAGVDWFERNNEGRFPDRWPLAAHFVSGLLRAALSARGERH